MLNTKAFSFAMGTGFMVMSAIALLAFGSGALAEVGIPRITGMGAVIGVIVSLAIMFIGGTVFGAIVGWLYNRFQAEPRMSEDVDIFVTS